QDGEGEDPLEEQRGDGAGLLPPELWDVFVLQLRDQRGGVEVRRQSGRVARVLRGGPVDRTAGDRDRLDLAAAELPVEVAELGLRRSRAGQAAQDDQQEDAHRDVEQEEPPGITPRLPRSAAEVEALPPSSTAPVV